MCSACTKQKTYIESKEEHSAHIWEFPLLASWVMLSVGHISGWCSPSLSRQSKGSKMFCIGARKTCLNLGFFRFGTPKALQNFAIPVDDRWSRMVFIQKKCSLLPRFLVDGKHTAHWRDRKMMENAKIMESRHQHENTHARSRGYG